MAILNRPEPSAEDARPLETAETRLRWNDTVRAGLVVKITESGEAYRGGSFLGRVLRFGALEKGVPSLVYLVVFAAVVVLLLSNLSVILAFLVRNVLSFVVVAAVLLVAFNLMSGGGKRGAGGAVAGKAGRLVVRSFLSVPRTVAGAVHEGVHDSIMRSRPRSDRDVEIRTYRLKQIDTATECDVCMRGEIRGAIPIEGDRVEFEGRLNRHRVFESTRGTNLKTRQKFSVSLPAWAR
jgi:hypothetical protein